LIVGSLSGRNHYLVITQLTLTAAAHCGNTAPPANCNKFARSCAGPENHFWFIFFDFNVCNNRFEVDWTAFAKLSLGETSKANIVLSVLKMDES